MKLMDQILLWVAVLLLALLAGLQRVQIGYLEPRIDHLTKSIDGLLEIEQLHSKSIGHINTTLGMITRTPDMVKMPDAPPLRYQLTDTTTVSLQYWTEKDGWQFIPKNFK